MIKVFFLHISAMLLILLQFQFSFWKKKPKLPVPAAVSCNCNDVAAYAPDTLHPEHTPLRWVRLNFHIIDAARDTQLNFTREQGKAFAYALIDECNRRLAENVKMNIPPDNNTPVLPLRFRYVIEGENGDDGIYYHRHDSLCFYNKTHRSKDFSLFSDAQFDTYGVRKGEVLNVFLLEHHPDSIASKTYKTSSDGVGKSKYLKMANAYHQFVNGSNYNMQDAVENFARLFNHEMGHSLGLPHTWATEDGCADTPKNRNCWYIDPNDPGCDEWGEVSNNVMDYNAFQRAYTPCQLSKIHYNFNQPDFSQRKLLLPVWCNYDAAETLTIRWGDNVRWCAARDLQGDVVVDSGAILTIACRLNMAENAKIIVRPGGTLRLDAAQINNICGKKWQGIELKKSFFWGKGKLDTLHHPQLLNCEKGIF